MILPSPAAAIEEAFPLSVADFFHARGAQSRMRAPWRARYLQWRIEAGASGAELLAETWLAFQARHHTAAEAFRVIRSRQPELFEASLLSSQRLCEAFGRLQSVFEQASESWEAPHEPELQHWSKKKTREQIQASSRELFTRLARRAREAALCSSPDELAIEEFLSESTEERKRQAREFLRLLHSLQLPLSALARPATRERLLQRFILGSSPTLATLLPLFPNSCEFCQQAGHLLASQVIGAPSNGAGISAAALHQFLIFSQGSSEQAVAAWDGFSKTLLAAKGPGWRDDFLQSIPDASPFLSIFQRLMRPGPRDRVCDWLTAATWERVWQAHARSGNSAEKIKRHLFLARHAPGHPLLEQEAIETLSQKKRAQLEQGLLTVALPTNDPQPARPQPRL